MKCIFVCVNSPRLPEGRGSQEVVFTKPLTEKYGLTDRPKKCKNNVSCHLWPCSALTFFIAAFDVALAVYNRYASGGGDSHNTVAYAAHVGGALAGLLVGMNVLRNFHKLVR